MRVLKVLIGLAAAGAIAMAFLDVERGRWLRPALPGGEFEDGEDEEEPVLGYDGMDRDTLLAWLRDAELDDETLRRIRRYEAAHEAREPVLAGLDDLIG